MNNYLYRAITKNGTCTGVPSNSALLTVNPLPTITGLLTVFAGSTTHLTGSGTAAPVNPWVSANTSVATVTNTGLVTGVVPGTSLITYTDNNGCSVSATVTVVTACSINPVTTPVANGTSTIYTAPAGMDTYTWSVTGNASITSGTNSQTVTVLAGNSCSDYTLKLDLTINGATSACSQTVSVTDNIMPTFTLPTLAAGHCVENIYEAVYLHDPVEPDDPDDDDLTYQRPDYYIFEKGSAILNLPSYSDNCALAVNPISWTIDFENDGTIDLSGTGQLQDYNSLPLVFPDRPVSGIKFPLGTNRITYTVADAAGNTMVQFVDLVVIPRPTIIKNF
jgi:hypothetical protein